MRYKKVEHLIIDWELRKQNLEKQLSFWQFSDGINRKVILTQRILDIDKFILDLKGIRGDSK